MQRISVQFSEDLRENNVTGKIYGILKDKGYNLLWVYTQYHVSTGTAKAEYILNGKAKLPEKSELEKMLNGIKAIASLEVFEPEEIE